MQVNYYTYKSLVFICTKCGWKGKGKELSHGNFSESTLIGDLECPKCFELIAFWQAPLSDKNDTSSPFTNGI